MSFDIDPIYLIYLLVGLSVALAVEAAYLLLFSTASYRSKVNRRLRILNDLQDRESILIQLRRERGLTSRGDYKLPLVAFNRLVLQSGLTMGIGRLVIFVTVGMAFVFAAVMFTQDDFGEAILIALFCGLVMPFVVLRTLRRRR